MIEGVSDAKGVDGLERGLDGCRNFLLGNLIAVNPGRV